MARSTTSSRLFTGSITRPLRITLALICGLESARDSRAAFGNPAKRNLVVAQKSFRRVAENGTRVACAPQTNTARSRRNSSTKIKNGHAHGETVGDLIEDDALQAVGDFAVDFDAAIEDRKSTRLNSSHVSES